MEGYCFLTDWESNLYSEKYTQEREELIAQSKDKIDLHIFKQWLLERENQIAKSNNDSLGIRIIGDSPVAVAPAIVWRNQDLYFENLSLGCPPDYFSQEGQRWGFSVLKPETIFNAVRIYVLFAKWYCIVVYSAKLKKNAAKAKYGNKM